MPHSVTFISLGPGDPELITLKSLNILRQADIIFCPSTKTAEGKKFSRALNILLELGIDDKKTELFHVAMDKNRAEAIKSYKHISDEIIKCFNDGAKIAVVAEGDTGFYSSIHYINDNLNQGGILTQREAGVPAFIACGALANIHVVKQEEELLVIPGIVTPEYLAEQVNAGKSVVIMKPSQCEDIVKETLTLPFDFHYFENVGIPEKEYYSKNTEEIEERKFPYFSLLIIQKQII